MFVEDTYSSEEMVDQQAVVVKVMDTADQVIIWSILFVYTKWTKVFGHKTISSACPCWTSHFRFVPPFLLEYPSLLYEGFPLDFEAWL